MRRIEGDAMSGKELRIKKLFGSKKNLVISALDHVMEYGVQAGIEDAGRAIHNCMGTDALLLPRHMLRRHWEIFTEEGAPMPVIRINWTSAFYYPLDYRRGYTRIAATVEEAVKEGAELAICSLFLENDDEQMETENIATFCEVVRQTEVLGIPLIGECYVVEHGEKSVDEVHDKVMRVVRVMVELGADLIKCFYTGDRFQEVVDNTPAPVFTIGAEKLDTDLAVLQKAYDSVTRGARGIIFGRNIFMAKQPGKLIDALNEVMNGGAEPEAAAKKHGLK
jgi:class I fructose-bisphosphate aldolase/fructose-bisphosphate aldolase/2-amino-3,7-dideoxy-D-threo-hept-6-ulosonate synthase